MGDFNKYNVCMSIFSMNLCNLLMPCIDSFLPTFAVKQNFIHIERNLYCQMFCINMVAHSSNSNAFGLFVSQRFQFIIPMDIIHIPHLQTIFVVTMGVASHRCHYFCSVSRSYRFNLNDILLTETLRYINRIY